jgi:hypothetical protein
MKRLRVMTTILMVACLSLNTGTLIGQGEVFEGSIAVGNYGRLPASGLYAASNAFPKNSTVRVTDASSGKSVDVLVVEGLSNPNIFLLLSPEAAEKVGMASDDVIRASVLEIPAGDPVPISSTAEQSANPDPDINPAASVPSDGEQAMIAAFIEEELAAADGAEAEKTALGDSKSPEAEAVEPVVKEEETKEAAALPPAEHTSGPDIPRAIALSEGLPSDDSKEWGGVESPALPEPPAGSPVESASSGPGISGPVIASLPSGTEPSSVESGYGWSSLPEPEVREGSQALAAEGSAGEVASSSRPVRILALPVLNAAGTDGTGWDRVDTPLVPRPREDRLMAGKAPTNGSYRIAVSDIPPLPESAESISSGLLLASAEERVAPEAEERADVSALAEPSLAEKGEEPGKEEIPAGPLLAESEGPRPPAETESEKDAGAAVPAPPERQIASVMVDEGESAGPIPEDAELVIESADARPPQVDTAELDAEEASKKAAIETLPEAGKAAVAADTSSEPKSTVPQTTSAPVPIDSYLVRDLDEHAYYLQIAVVKEADAAGRLAQSLASTYPVTIHPKDDGAGYRVMVGPLRKDESGALLLSFRAGGYRDAFLRKGN